ncbi:MAG: thiamine pyrophosphate-binding protein [Candidatus Lokiarchaeota archaeon]|nr:thiamine pyrophosphate-binding protein [Candidatus Lokiarchaeota archaeon]
MAEKKKEEQASQGFHGGDALVRALHAEGVDHVFGIPGGEFLPFLEALDRWGTNNGMHYVNVRNEAAAAHMADAYARATGKPAVCCGTVGPGFANLIPGIVTASWDSIPMIVIHPQQNPKFDDQHRFQGGLDQLAMLRQIVKYQKHESNPNRVVATVQKAFKELSAGRPRPVQLEFSEDAMWGSVEDYGMRILKPAQYRAIASPAGNPETIKAACDLLLKAQKPLIVAGGGVVASNSWDKLQKLSLTHGLPCITTDMGTGAMSSNHETFIGTTISAGGAQKAARECDFILLLGTKFGFDMAYGKAPLWNADARAVQVDIDPFMIGKNRSIDLGILGDVGVVLGQLNDELNRRGVNTIPAPDWLPALKKERELAVQSLKAKFESTKIPIDPHRLIADLTTFMNPDDVLCIDGGDIAVLVMNDIDFLKHREPRSVMRSSALGMLGTCIPYAIGAKLGKPDKRVFSITGDGSFLFHVQELDTAIKYCLPFVVVIADNCKWGMIANREKSDFKKRDPFCVELCSNYVSIAKGFGCYAERVDDPAQIKPALQRAVDSELPAVLQVPIKFVTPPGTTILQSFGNLKF